jgi:site-specific DNA-methyltransferase (adenine-specific)
MGVRRRPGEVRDAIIDFLRSRREATVAEIREAVAKRVGDVPSSSVRSYLNLNTPGVFERVGRGRYRLRR